MVAHHGNHVEHDEAHDYHVKLLVADDSEHNCLDVKKNQFNQLAAINFKTDGRVVAEIIYKDFWRKVLSKGKPVEPSLALAGPLLVSCCPPSSSRQCTSAGPPS